MATSCISRKSCFNSKVRIYQKAFTSISSIDLANSGIFASTVSQLRSGKLLVRSLPLNISESARITKHLNAPLALPSSRSRTSSTPSSHCWNTFRTTSSVTKSLNTGRSQSLAKRNMRGSMLPEEMHDFPSLTALCETLRGMLALVSGYIANHRTTFSSCC